MNPSGDEHAANRGIEVVLLIATETERLRNTVRELRDLACDAWPMHPDDPSHLPCKGGSGGRGRMIDRSLRVGLGRSARE
jgi:hypothetical protein